MRGLIMDTTKLEPGTTVTIKVKESRRTAGQWIEADETYSCCVLRRINSKTEHYETAKTGIHYQVAFWPKNGIADYASSVVVHHDSLEEVGEVVPLDQIILGKGKKNPGWVYFRDKALIKMLKEQPMVADRVWLLHRGHIVGENKQRVLIIRKRGSRGIQGHSYTCNKYENNEQLICHASELDWESLTPLDKLTDEERLLSENKIIRGSFFCGNVQAQDQSVANMERHLNPTFDSLDHASCFFSYIKEDRKMFGAQFSKEERARVREAMKQYGLDELEQEFERLSKRMKQVVKDMEREIRKPPQQNDD